MHAKRIAIPSRATLTYGGDVGYHVDPRHDDRVDVGVAGAARAETICEVALPGPSGHALARRWRIRVAFAIHSSHPERGARVDNHIWLPFTMSEEEPDTRFLRSRAMPEMVVRRRRVPCRPSGCSSGLRPGPVLRGCPATSCATSTDRPAPAPGGSGCGPQTPGKLRPASWDAGSLIPQVEADPNLILGDVVQRRVNGLLVHQQRAASLHRQRRGLLQRQDLGIAKLVRRAMILDAVHGGCAGSPACSRSRGSHP